ncbi:MAG: hypothetical protein VX916_04065 [Planctomycetota bacterium]|nr:hypothetical protein [Planctomycetota bacterium]
MALVYRSLVTAIVILHLVAMAGGMELGETTEKSAHHLRVGLLVSLATIFIHSLAFAYFLGTGFWIRAFARASRAATTWEERHSQWMKARGYPWLYLAAVFPAAVAITGSLSDTGRLTGGWHAALASASFLVQIAVFFLVPPMMRRNAALMDDLAQTHHVPQPGTEDMEALLEKERAEALPPLFQLSRVLLFGAFNLLILWAYLRFGTETLRGVALWPFASASSGLVILGIGLNARHDPDHPASAVAAWTRGVLFGGFLFSILTGFHYLLTA